MSDKPKSRVVLLGLDGATWRIIDKMMEAGRLPNFSRMMKRGSYGNLRSLEYAVSPRVWTSIATGKVEEKHGIFDFYNTIKDLNAKRIWDILFERYGDTATVFYWYLTWPPPEDFKNVMVPGFLARDSRTVPEKYAFIKDIEITQKMKIQESYNNVGLIYYIKQALNAWRNGLKLRTMFKALTFMIGRKINNYSELESFHKLMVLKYHIHTDVFLKIMKKDPSDFSAIIIPQPDQLGHKYWHFMEPEDFEQRTGNKVSEKDIKRYGNVMWDMYDKIDRFIGDVYKTLNDDDLICVLSDHGFGPVKEIYASLKIKSKEFLELLGLGGAAHCVSLGFSYFIQIDDADKSDKLDQIKTVIENITLQDEKKKLFEVSKNNDKEIVIKLQDLVLMNPGEAETFMKRKLKVNGKIIDVQNIFISRPDITGEHEPLGIVLFAGKNIKQGHKLDEGSVLDVVPTILYLKDLPLAKDMDGKIIEGAISEDYIAKNPVQYIDTYETGENRSKEETEDHSMTDDLEQRLKSLGYLG
ncbi:MAG: alkaline phosphatase family protein [candidate division KSB1 bacterium]|jgi:predicted AlkP superfamily phosphohydrolase/phosphomutase|nr:alkaline phosphatase family protein [candidate division KSB1 bacterium]